MTPAEAEFRTRYREANERVAAAGAAYLARKAVRDEIIRKREQQELTRKIELGLLRAASKFKPSRPSPYRIIASIAEPHGWTVEHLIGPSHCVETCKARNKAMAAVWKLYPEKGVSWLARQFERDTTNVRHTLERMGIYQHPDFGRRKTAP